MTTVNEIIKRALRMAGRLGSGEDPSVTEGEDALVTYNTFLRSLFGSVIGDVLTVKVVSGANPAVHGGQYITGSVATPLTFPASPKAGNRIGIAAGSGGASVVPNGLKVMNSTSTRAIAAGVSETFFFRDDLGNWELERDHAALSEDIYLAADTHDAMASCVAYKLIPEYMEGRQNERAPDARLGLAAINNRYGRRGRNIKLPYYLLGGPAAAA